MKASIKTACAVLTLFAVSAVPAMAQSHSGQPIEGEIRSAVTSGNINVIVEDGVATLYGWVEDGNSLQAAKRAALSYENVDKVVSLVTVS